MTPVIRAATPGDGPAISRIMSDWIEETPWMPRIHDADEQEQFGSWLIDLADVTVAETPDRVVGFIARRDAAIHALYLEARARGQGLGTALVAHEKRRTENLSLWTFVQNVGARRFYVRNGFQEVERTDGARNDEGLPDIRFVWRKEDASNGGR